MTQGGNRPGSSKRNSGNGVNYPLINVNAAGQQAQAPAEQGAAPQLEGLPRTVVFETWEKEATLLQPGSSYSLSAMVRSFELQVSASASRV